MKVLSLNINDFGGIKCLESYKKQKKLNEWYSLDKISEATEIFTYIQNKKAEIVILHEFELNTNEADVFIECMDKIDYGVVPYEATNLIKPSMTIMFVNKELLYEKLQNPHTLKSGKDLRTSVIKVADCYIYAVHIPQRYDSDFWDELIEFYDKHKEKKLVIIGDWNVYDIGTQQKNRYLELINRRACDAWIEKGYPNETKTYIKGRRLDYAIMSPTMYQCLYKICTDTYLMDNKKTDHAALIIEI